MTITDNAPLEDQKRVMKVVKSLERTDPSCEVLERELILGCYYVKIKNPETCITELLLDGHLYHPECTKGVIKRVG